MRVVGKSLTNTVNLVVAGSAAVGAAALHAYALPILALGGVAYAALVAWDLSTPSFWKKSLAPDPVRLPSPDELSDASLRDVVKSLLAGREQLFLVLVETPDEVKSHLGGVISATREMEERAARLIKRAEDLTRYLASTDLEAVRREITKLEDKVRSSRDKATREQYEQAKTMREEQLRALDDIAGARERAMANLTRMVATLEGLGPKIVRMRALDAQAMDAMSGSISDELGRINDDIKAFEETLESLGEIAQS